MEKSIKDEGLNDLLREIDSAEEKCLEALKRLRKQRSELTGEDIIEFTVFNIHKDRMGIILSKVMKVDSTQSYNKLKEQWRASAKTDQGWWLGEVKASGPKEKLLSVMHKIAKEGGTITVDPVHKIEIPPANKWWDAEWFDKMEAEKEAKREAKKSEKQESE